MHADVASYLQFYTFLIGIIRPAIVIALLSGLWLALRRLTLMPGERIITWLTVAVPLVLWLGVVWNLAEAGAFQARPGVTSPLPIAVAVPVLIGLIGLMSSRRIAAAVDAAPVAWLIALQVYRLIGGNFIFLWLYGAVPGSRCRPVSAICSSVSSPSPSRSILRRVAPAAWPWRSPGIFSAFLTS